MTIWKKTTPEVYFSIYNQHKNDFGVFGTCTCPEGEPRFGKTNPYIYTEWGFKDADEPIIMCERTKESVDQKEWDDEFFLAKYYNNDD
jgi:hypothetical protein